MNPVDAAFGQLHWQFVVVLSAVLGTVALFFRTRGWKQLSWWTLYVAASTLFGSLFIIALLPPADQASREFQDSVSPYVTGLSLLWFTLVVIAIWRDRQKLAWLMAGAFFIGWLSVGAVAVFNGLFFFLWVVLVSNPIVLTLLIALCIGGAVLWRRYGAVRRGAA